MGNPANWDQVETLTEGLVMIAGWSGGHNETGLTAELLISEADEHEILFVVSESPTLLELVVRLTLNFQRASKEDRFHNSLTLISKLFLDESLPQHLKMASWDPKSAVYDFVYPWKCDAELQQELTLPVLHHTIVRWSGPMSMPALSLAPLLGLYLRGMFKRDADFVDEAKKSLGMIAVPTKGHA
jgi:hypothetical protein